MALPRLVDYSSSDDSSSESERGKDGRNNSRSSNNRSSNSSSGQDYCSDSSSKGEEDAGHVRGGWSGHVYLRIRSSTQLHRLALACMDAICPRLDDNIRGNAKSADILDLEKVRTIEEPHISLTRPFYLPEHQIAGFVRELESCLNGLGPLAVGFGRISTYVNERQDRGFVAADVDYGEESVRRVLDHVNRLMEKFGQRKFFRDPRFHVSLLSVDLTPGSNKMSKVGATLGAAMGEEIAHLVAMQIDEVECIFGNKKFSFGLDAK
ncbi:poly(U)-specific 3'-to-5' RNA exonuclease [Coemansia aciculifera]|uniref:U6 snRNA phosphodiesterase 1 n=1 Tax=Coemansia aciculifera TaxID=417176 RepID=A0A9W8M682_9FUNG|nr:poly(U)-specific 3'-to-5' RNA exonuclease [Coemansia aciculifera]